MKILITGGAGFIGSHITDHLIARMDTVSVLDNFTTGRPENLGKSDNLTLIEGDIAIKSVVDRAFNDFKPEIVIHAAASYKDPNNWEGDSKTNVLGTANVVQACQRTGIRRLIYFQTALCYGLHPQQQPIPVDHPLDPANSSYAISKTAGEHYIRLSGLDFISFRLANIIGPRNLSGPIPIFYQRLSEGKPCFVMDTRRDFVFVKDLVDIVVKAIDGQGKAGIYHVSSGGDYVIKEVFDATVKTLGITLEQEVEVHPRDPGDAFTILLDPSKTHRDFDWKTSTQLETAVCAAVEWYNQHGITQAYSHLKSEKDK